ncbi:MAG: DUF115 domain-containing protein [Eubacteriales bacterium]|nr:DUF115 domain-containing protein [Eubacteriales bacterium]
MDQYQKNLSFFKEKSIFIYNCLQSDKPRFDSKVSVMDPLNIKVEYDAKACYIHSLYNTGREAFEMFSKTDPGVETIVVFGAGLWHCYNDLISHFKQLIQIVVIEPDLNLFKAILNFVDIESLLNQCPITFLINQQKEDVIETLWKFFNANISMKMEFVYNLSYRSLYADYYHFIHRGVTLKIKSCLINTATEKTFTFQWAENTARNFRHNALPLTKFRHCFAGLPIIIVSAGPSLNYNMHFLNQVKDKAVIMAVGSAVKILDSNGIVPHFRMAIDPGEHELNVFSHIDTGAAPLIFSDRLYHEILDQYKGSKIRMLMDNDYTGQYIYEKLYHDRFTITSGFSIANIAMDAAVKLGFTKIILIGQDLCYTEGSLHARGSWWLDQGIDESDSKYIKTVNSLGETVYTDKPFLGMKGIFEDFILANPDRTYINATERGLTISGAVNKPMDKVIEEDLAETADIDRRIEDILTQNQLNDLEWKQRLTELNLEGQIKELNNLNELQLTRLKKLKKSFDRGAGINKLKSELEYIDKNITHPMQNNELYKVAVFRSLNVFIYAIRIKYQYYDQDEVKAVENKIDRLLSEAAVLKQYLDVLAVNYYRT